MESKGRDKDDPAVVEPVSSDSAVGNNNHIHSEPMGGFDSARQWIGTLLPFLAIIAAGLIFAVRQEGRIDVLEARLATVATVQTDMREIARRQAETHSEIRELTASVQALAKSLVRERDVNVSTLKAARDDLSKRIERVERDVVVLRQRVMGWRSRPGQ